MQVNLGKKVVALEQEYDGGAQDFTGEYEITIEDALPASEQVAV
jgi:hypothetical protein